MAVEFGEGFVPVSLRYTGFGQQLSAMQRMFEGTMARMDAVASGAKWVGILGGGAMAVAVRSAANFEQGMARVKALTGATGGEFDALSAKAKELGRTTMFSAKQSAEGMSFLALAGFDAKKIIESMGPTLDLAAAGQMDVAQAADITAKIMAGMGLEAKDLGKTVDVLAKAFTTSNTDLTQLGEALKYVGPVGKAAGKDLGELVAVIQTMSNAGIQGAMAGTSLRNILTQLTGSTKETNDVFKKLDVQMLTASGGMRPLADIVDDLNAAMGKLGEAERVGLLMKAFGQRAGPGMAAMLAEGGDALRKLESKLDDVGGTAKRISDVQMEGLTGSLAKFKSALDGLKIAMGEELLPALTAYTRKLTDLTGEAAKADEATRRQVLGYVEMAAKMAAVAYVAPKLLRLVGSAGLLGAFNPLATAAAVSLMAISMAESVTTGKAYNQVLYENIKLLTTAADATDRLMASQGKLKPGETAAATARQVAQEKGPGSKEAVQAAEKALDVTRADLARVTGITKAGLHTRGKTAPGVFGGPMAGILAEKRQRVARVREEWDPLLATARTRVREAYRNLQQARVDQLMTMPGQAFGAIRSGQVSGAVRGWHQRGLERQRAKRGALATLFDKPSFGSLFRVPGKALGAGLGKGVLAGTEMAQRRREGEENFKEMLATLGHVGGAMGGLVSGGMGGLSAWYQRNRGQIGANVNQAMAGPPSAGPQFMGAAQYSRYVQQGVGEKLDKTRNDLLKDGNKTMDALLNFRRFQGDI